MKIHLEFNNMAEMYLYCKTLMNNVTPQQMPESGNVASKLRKECDDWRFKYQRTLDNLERAYERIRLLDPKGNTMNVTPKEIADNLENIFSESVHTLDLPIRPLNCLVAEGIETIGALMKKTRIELRRIPNLGKGSLKEIEDALFAKYKLHLKDAS